jgi:hypothetical protein
VARSAQLQFDVVLIFDIDVNLRHTLVKRQNYI